MVARIETKLLVEAANQLVSKFVDRTPHFQMFMELNDALLNLTNSEYGFIARVFRNAKGPYIKTVALSNIAWNSETKKLYAENAERGMVFDNLDTIFGQVLKTGETYITLDAKNDPNAAGIPAGHPDLKRFAGIPLVRRDMFIGMIGLANGDNYSDEMVSELQPVLDVTSHILHATGLQQELIPDGNYFRQPQAILNTFRSGVLSIDTQGVITSANQSAADIFGYTIDELMGQKVVNFIPPTGTELLYNTDNQLAPSAGAFGRVFEAIGVNKISSYFPIEISIDEVEDSQPPQYALVVRNITEEKKQQRFKDEFISMISHELRTPLTAVHISLSMLDSPEHRPTNITELNDMISIANRNCGRLVQLVDEILDYEKMNLDEIEFNFQPITLESFLIPVVETTRILAERSDIKLEFSTPDHPFKLAADSNRLSQVLINLITNAIRASSAGQTVNIQISELPDNAQLRFSVQDFGTGIAPEHVERIFDPFEQLGENPAGAGLGLAICKRIVENHDSRLSCESKLGSGTTFQFNMYQFCELNPQFKPNQSPNTSLKQILWIENDRDHFESTIKNLNLDDVQHHLRTNCQLAKTFLNSNPIDLIVIGHPIAIQTSESFVKQIRNDNVLADTPIVLYSNGLSAEHVEELLQLNVECGIKKSWNQEALQEQIRKGLGT